MKTLIIGDIIGNIGRETLKATLPKVIDMYKVDCVIANGENLAGGFGITKGTADQIFAMGVDVITSGNHIWDKKEALKLLEHEERILRPHNYPPNSVPGTGARVYDINGLKIGVINLMGRVFMHFYDDPFRSADEILGWMKNETDLIFVDFHGEATSEKQAMGYYLDGRVTSITCTHTHVQTADERVLNGGTAYITDVGMVGPIDSIIGLKREEAMRRFHTLIPQRFMEVPHGDGIMCAVIVEADEKSGRAKSITRLQLKHNVKENHR